MNRIILFTAALLNTFYFLLLAVPQCDNWQQTAQSSIIAGNAAAPYNYRVLVPFLLSPLMGDTLPSIALGYTVYHLVILPVLFFALYAWLREWVSADRAAIGVLLLAVIHPLMYWVAYCTAGYSPMEGVLLCLGLLVIWRLRRSSSLPR